MPAAVAGFTGFVLAAMCQGLLWIEFVMASTRVASVSFRLKRVRRFLNLSMISYVVLVTLPTVLTLRGFQSAYFSALAVALNSFIGISAGVLFLYSSHKMAAQHSQRAYITPLICPEGARVPLVDRGLWPQHLLCDHPGEIICAHVVEHQRADHKDFRQRFTAL